MKCLSTITIFFLLTVSCSQKPEENGFLLADATGAKTIYLDTEADSLIQWATHELAKEIFQITGQKPRVVQASSFNDDGIYVGVSGASHLPPNVIDKDSVPAWESFQIKKHNNSLILTGSDIRGTVFGIFELTERLGVSPWSWWADVPIIKKDLLLLTLDKEGISQSPSVQYRGIFLNDEDWGLQPWAAKNFEPELGDIGPKTYEKIFQLMLRLKANTLWPAMHPCTKGFLTVPGTMEMAKRYHIVIGTSHAEPMLRNNVSEWDHDRFGEYNYFENADRINAYWQERVDQVAQGGMETMMTLGMRGIHDSGMEGARDQKEAVETLETIFEKQRSMLRSSFKTGIESIPQVFIPYKEVLELYDNGLEVPDDVTLMWTDDNYGYIRRLSDTEEQKRAGGSGVYYHLSYWGRPHDYLWLSAVQPGLIWYEMRRAYESGARKIWIANVGDIKPGEYGMEFFLDLAWDIGMVDETNISYHFEQWAKREFGIAMAKPLTDIYNEYYRLALLRKPEYMGWSQTEPQTPVHRTAFSNTEAGHRIAAYEKLEQKIDSLEVSLEPERRSAWFQLVEYPIKGAANMNKKWLYRQLALTSTDLNRTNKYQKMSTNAYGSIVDLTTYYNQLEYGKWNGMMDMAPRNLAVFAAPDFSSETNSDTTSVKTVKGRSASRFDVKKGSGAYEWKVIKNFGYGEGAMALFPLNHTKFENESPWVAYDFKAEEAGTFIVEVRLLPTHVNQHDQKLGIQVNDGEISWHLFSTEGRSEQWKENVLRNSAVVTEAFEIEKPGNMRITLHANQTGIVIDQLAVRRPGRMTYGLEVER